MYVSRKDSTVDQKYTPNEIEYKWQQQWEEKSSYSVTEDKNKQKHYSSFLQSITTSRSTIFISSMILSEFSNRNLRMDFVLWKDDTGKHNADFKKDYVGTVRYKETVQEIQSGSVRIHRVWR